MSQDGFINFLESNYFLEKEEFEPQILSPRRPPPQNESPHNVGTSILAQAFKAKITTVMMNEKKLTNEIFQRSS